VISVEPGKVLDGHALDGKFINISKRRQLGLFRGLDMRILCC